MNVSNNGSDSSYVTSSRWHEHHQVNEDVSFTTPDYLIEGKVEAKSFTPEGVWISDSIRVKSISPLPNRRIPVSLIKAADDNLLCAFVFEEYGAAVVSLHIMDLEKALASS